MPLNERNTRVFHRTLYATQLQTVTLLKRNDDQKAGTVTTFKIYQARWSMIFKSGEPILGEMAADHRRRLHIPTIQMDRIGVHYFNVLDRFVDREKRVWQPESGQLLTSKLFENHHCIDCLMVDGRELHG